MVVHSVMSGGLRPLPSRPLDGMKRLFYHHRVVGGCRPGGN
jgi:hypothetical protein